MQFNVYLPPELVRRFKHRAIDEGRSLSAITQSALTEYLDAADREKVTAKKQSR